MGRYPWFTSRSEAATFGARDSPARPVHFQELCDPFSRLARVGPRAGPHAERLRAHAGRDPSRCPGVARQRRTAAGFGHAVSRDETRGLHALGPRAGGATESRGRTGGAGRQGNAHHKSARQGAEPLERSAGDRPDAGARRTSVGDVRGRGRRAVSKGTDARGPAERLRIFVAERGPSRLSPNPPRAFSPAPSCAPPHRAPPAPAASPPPPP